MRILLVDDDPHILRSTCLLLRGHCDVVTAPGPLEGMDVLASGHFDAVVSDYAMPDGTGIEFLKAVQECWPNIRRILHTGAVPSEVAERLRDGTLHALLQKPCSLDPFLAALK